MCDSHAEKCKPRELTAPGFAHKVSNPRDWSQHPQETVDPCAPSLIHVAPVPLPHPTPASSGPQGPVPSFSTPPEPGLLGLQSPCAIPRQDGGCAGVTDVCAAEFGLCVGSGDPNPSLHTAHKCYIY